MPRSDAATSIGSLTRVSAGSTARSSGNARPTTAASSEGRPRGGGAARAGARGAGDPRGHNDGELLPHGYGRGGGGGGRGDWVDPAGGMGAHERGVRQGGEPRLGPRRRAVYHDRDRMSRD